MRALWPRWTLLPPAACLAYGTLMIIIGDIRWDHVVMMMLMPFLAYYNEWTKKLFLGAHPMAHVALLYDGMRYVKNVGVSPERVHNCDLRDLEMKLFGVTVGGEKMTLNDFFLKHHWDWLDIYCSIPYGTFIFACLGVAVVLYFKDYEAVQRYSWVFFLMNILAYITYHVYPAAPPWYYHAHGCEISMTAMPSAGPRLLNVDAVLGITYFKGIYERSSDLYGAVPSLHVAYPLLIVVEGWRSFKWFGRTLSLIFFVSMAFAAVYLDHHWVFDVVLGGFYCVGATALVRYVQGRARGGVAAAPPSALQGS
jgi:hypothetical protein